MILIFCSLFHSEKKIKFSRPGRLPLRITQLIKEKKNEDIGIQPPMN